MSETAPYSKIIYKGREDKGQEDLVSPYKHRSISRNKQNRWSPEISRNEHLKKKLERENEYIKKLEDPDKPVLMIQQKQVFKNLHDPHFISPKENDFFKVTNETKVIDDIETHVEATRDDTRRPTKVHLSKAPADQEIYQKGVHKIEGLEFLPEGFLELDPILLMTDYEFASYLDREKFTEEQRKVKALRRKQYQDRDKARNRKVTIFVVNEYKDRLMEYFEEWYAQNRRKMSPEELEYIANILQSDLATITRLQDLFLQRKKVVNSSHLHKFEIRNREVKNLQSEEVPAELKKLFLTGPTDAYLKTEPRLAAGGQSYNPTYITKYQEKYGRRQRKENPLSKSQTKLKSARTQPLDPGAEDLTKFTRDFEALLGSAAKPVSVQNSGALPATLTSKTASPFKNTPDEDLKVYFDEEINAILDKIRACKGNESGAQSDGKAATQAYIDMHKQRLQTLISQLGEEERRKKEKSAAKPEVDIAQPLFGGDGLGEETEDTGAVKKDSYFNVSATPEEALIKKTSAVAAFEELRKNTQGKKSTLDVIRMESMLLKYNMNPDEFRPKADTTLNQNWMMYDIRPPNLSIPNLEALAGPTRHSIIGNHRVSTASPNEDVIMSYPVSEFVPVDSPDTPAPSPSIGNKESLSSLPRPNSTTESVREKKTTVIRPSDAPPLKPARITVISKQKKHFDKVTSKFLPHLGKVEYFYEVISDGLPINGKRQAVLMTLNSAQELILIDELSEDTADKMYLDFMMGVYDKNTYLVIVRNKNQEVVEVFKLSFENELTEAEAKHILSLATDIPLKKTTVIEEFVVEAEAARKASSISRSKSPTAKGSVGNKTKAKSMVEGKLSAKQSAAPRLTSKVEDPNAERQMEQQLDQIHEDAGEEGEFRGSSGVGGKISFGKQSVNDKELVNVARASGSQNGVAPGLDDASANRESKFEVIDQSEHDRAVSNGDNIQSRSVGTGSFSRAQDNSDPTPKTSVVSSNQLVKKSSQLTANDPPTLLKNDAPIEGRLTFQDQSMSESHQEDNRQSVKEPKRTSFVALKNTLVERSSELARQSSASKSQTLSDRKSTSQNATPFGGQAFEELAEEKETATAEDPEAKPRSTRHEQAFNELLNEYKERASTAKTSEPPKISAQDAEQIRHSIQKMLDGARGSAQGGLMKEFEDQLKQAGNDPTLIDQFFQFCREKLPSDQKYKESVLFVSLFYYFLEKKNMIN